MFYQLPPVGNPVTLDKSKKLNVLSVFSTYQSQFYASGTAALAAAIVAVLQNTKRSESASQAEIILPAYGCPDLISAAIFAGAKPVLVDLAVDRPWLDLSLLQAAITENTVAIVAVSLFGIAERWPQLRVVCDEHKLILIEDSAQYFPAKDENSDWQGDLVVLSFGRGKPVSLLSGGAVLTNNKLLYEKLPKPQAEPARFSKQLLNSLKIRLYNVMISPLLYWLPQTLPLLHLGETRYHALLSIKGMERVALDRLASNIFRYQNDNDAMDRRNKISSMLADFNEINNLPETCNTEENRRLLRYPLLLEEDIRDRVYQRLNQAGLGVSTMYPTILTKIAGMDYLLDIRPHYPNAEAFASRLLTLPTHGYLSEKNIQKIKAILRETLH